MMRTEKFPDDGFIPCKSMRQQILEILTACGSTTYADIHDRTIGRNNRKDAELRALVEEGVIERGFKLSPHGRMVAAYKLVQPASPPTG